MDFNQLSNTIVSKLNFIDKQNINFLIERDIMFVNLYDSQCWISIRQYEGDEPSVIVGTPASKVELDNSFDIKDFFTKKFIGFISNLK
jgi:hypothetical protein